MRHGLAPWLRWIPRRRALPGRGDPLFFHHVAKTGGTSLIKAILSVVPPELAFSEDGNLSAQFASDLAWRGLAPGQFIYGHPATGAALPLRGRAASVILLRDPRDQAISNYLHIRTHRTVPDYGIARELDFRGFLLARPYFAIFQTASLHVGIEQRPLRRTEDLIDRLPTVLDYLRGAHYLGTIGTAEMLLAELAGAMEWLATPRLPHRRKSRVSPSARKRMREQYTELRNHPVLGPLMAAEQFVFDTSREIAAAAPRANRAPAEPAADGRGPPAGDARRL